MSKQIIVPPLGESVSEATVGKWHKKLGESVKQDELLVELETDKVTLEVNSPATGILGEILANSGSNVGIGAILGNVQDGSAESVQASQSIVPQAVAVKQEPVQEAPKKEEKADLPASPAANKIMQENNINKADISGTGKDGRITKSDVISHGNSSSKDQNAVKDNNAAREERVKMTRLRKRIAERLKESQNTAAILTTFNEIDMSNVMALRDKYKEEFQTKHGVKLGFMSFFVKSCVNALKSIPAVNAEIDGDDIVYKNYYDIGVAVGTDQGLVVPIVRDADKKNFAEIEKNISELGKKARDGKLSMQDLSGGTFSISNGGVYGSLLSTPIINPPQSGILGMHNTQMRPVAINGKVEIRPMMYIALSYDHRIIDGKEAVTFLIKVKEAVENPEKLLFEL